MTKREHNLLGDLAQQTLTELGGRGTVADVADHLRLAYPDVYAEEVARGWNQVVRNALRRSSKADSAGGLPSAVSNGDEYVQLAILEVDEYEYAITQYLKRARANRRVADRMAQQCLAVHGVKIDVDALAAEASA